MGRIRFYWEYLGLVRKGLVAACVIMSNLSWLPGRWRAHLFFLIPNWSWQTWLLIGAVLLCAFILEEAYYRNLVLEAEEQADKPEQRFLVPILASILIAFCWAGSVVLQIHQSKIATSVAARSAIKVASPPDNASVSQPPVTPTGSIHTKRAKLRPAAPVSVNPSTPAAAPSYNAPGGIIVPNNQGIVTNPTVNNFGPPPIQFSWQVRDIVPPAKNGAAQYGYEEEVTITPTATYTPVSIGVQCDSEIAAISGMPEGAVAMTNWISSPAVQDKRVGLVYFGGTPITPSRPLIVHIWANHPFSVLAVGQAKIAGLSD